jgi:hypothetical protein
MLQDYETTMSHWNAEEENEEILGSRISYAYRFGSDLVPFSAVDEAGISTSSPVQLTVLGYMSRKNVPDYLRIGPPYILSGNESRRSCAAISALARALQRMDQVAIATFVKTKDRDPILCGLFPFEGGNEPIHLVMMQLPFADDVRIYEMADSCGGSDNRNENQRAAKVCDDLIDKLMLPDDALDYTQIPNPKIRSFYKTIIKRVVNKNSPVVDARVVDGQDQMGTPNYIQERAQPAIDAFYKTFPLKQSNQASR